MPSHPPTNRPDRVWIDSTYTIQSGLNSGIERVVRNVLRHLCEDPVTSEARQVIAYDGRFYPVNAEIRRRFANLTSFHRNAQAALPPTYLRLAKAACSLFGHTNLRRWFLPKPGHLGVFKLFYKRRLRALLREIPKLAEPIEMDSRDLLVLPDAYWVRMDAWRAIEAVRARGAFAATVAYDLIPITHPEFVGQSRSHDFKKYVVELARHSDVIFAISRTVRDQLREYLPTLVPGGCQRVESFDLGSEINICDGHVRPDVKQNFDVANNPYLMVATFDPRKNHSYLIETFEHLWKKYPELKVCLVGRVGWLCKDLIEQLRQHPRRGKQLLVYHDLSDSELFYCYRHARAVVMPSVVEGYGLPIVEALWHRQMTFASDTAIHREVGGEMVKYFDLADSQTLVDLIDDYERQGAPTPQQGETYRVTTWRESASSLLASAEIAYAERNESSQRRAA